MAFADLLEQVGGVGRFQIINAFLLLLPLPLLMTHYFLQNFTAVIPGHHCKLPPMDNTSANWEGGWDPAKLVRVFVPLDGSHQPKKCLQYTRAQWWLLQPNSTATNTTEMDTEPCKNGWTYDRSEFSSTIITEWNLVCNKKTMMQVGQLFSMAGLLVGVIILGRLSDRYGRQTVFLWSHLLTALMGLCSTFSPNFVCYCIFRFLTSVVISGVGLNTPSLIIEWIPTRKRTIFGTLTGYFYTTGQVLLAGLAYAIRDWRWLQLTVFLPFFIFFLYSWWIPESARWLVLAKKPEQALKMLKKVAKINRRHEEAENLTIENLKSSMEKEIAASEFTHTIADLVRTNAMRHISFSISIIWFSTSLSYYSLATDLQSFGINIYLIQIIFGAIDIPARFITSMAMCFIGRRTVLKTSFLIANLVMLATIFVPKDMQILRTSLAVIAKGCYASCFTCSVLFTAELYPTVIRQSGLGLGYTIGRIGSMLAPLLKMTDEYVSSLPFIIYGAMSLVSILVISFLPETKDQPLRETIEREEKSAPYSKRKELRKIWSTKGIQNVDIPMDKPECQA